MGLASAMAMTIAMTTRTRCMYPPSNRSFRTAPVAGPPALSELLLCRRVAFRIFRAEHDFISGVHLHFGIHFRVDHDAVANLQVSALGWLFVFRVFRRLF